MRTYDNGSGFTVSFSESDADEFNASWPCSTVNGPGWFAYDNNGDLTDCGGEADHGDGADWLAFSQDCQKYGEQRIGALRKRHERAEKKSSFSS